jgi:hypothetical protein
MANLFFQGKAINMAQLSSFLKGYEIFSMLLFKVLKNATGLKGSGLFEICESFGSFTKIN